MFTTAKDVKCCLVPDCDRKPLTRGLCQQCYTVARKLIASGRTTWTKLEGLKLARRFVPRSAKFTAAFESAIAKTNGHSKSPAGLRTRKRVSPGRGGRR